VFLASCPSYSPAAAKRGSWFTQHSWAEPRSRESRKSEKRQKRKAILLRGPRMAVYPTRRSAVRTNGCTTRGYFRTAATLREELAKSSTLSHQKFLRSRESHSRLLRSHALHLSASALDRAQSFAQDILEQRTKSVGTEALAQEIKSNETRAP